MVSVTGYQLQQAIKRRMFAQEIAFKQFSEGLHYFPSESRPDIENIFKVLDKAEKEIASLQTIQTKYNLLVQVDVLGETLSLLEAVKRIGGAGRGEKLWRTAAKGEDRERWERQQTSRSKDNEYALPTIEPSEALKHANKQAKYASALRTAIQTGNAQKMEMDFDPALLED